MATLDVQRPGQGGEEIVYVPADAAGDQYLAGRDRALHIVNDRASDITVTVDSQLACDQGFDHDLEIVVPAGEDRFCGFFEQGRFSDAAGYARVFYSAVTNITVAVIEG